MNTDLAIAIAAGFLLAAVLAVVAYFLLRKKVQSERAQIRTDADRALAEAKRAAEAKLREASIEAKERVLAAQAEFEKGVQTRRQEIGALEKRVVGKEENLDRKLAQQERREEEYGRKEKALADAQKRVEEAQAEALRVIDEQRRRLEQISGLTAVDAKRDLIKSIENEARVEAAGMMRRIEEEATEQATQKARRVIGMAIQRCAAEHAIETTVSVVDLPSDDSEGTHHRPRGAQHPRARARHRRRPDRRRHARRDHPVGLRSLPPRDREAGDRAADRRRPHPPGAHRRGRPEGEGRDRRERMRKEGAAVALRARRSTICIRRSCG